MGTRSYEFGRRLVAAGHQVTILCGESHLADVPAEVAGMQVIQIPVSCSNRDSFFWRIYSFLRFAVSCSWKALRLDYDLVLATSTPLTVGVPALVAKCLRRKKFIFEVRDLWPELPKAMGIIRNPLILWMLEKFEWFCYRSADACIGLSPGIVAGIQKKVPSARVVQIPNGCDLKLFQPTAKSAEMPDVQDETRVIFCGAHGKANGLDAVLDAFAVLKRRGRLNIKCLLVGDGQLKPALCQRAEAEGLENCTFLDPLPKEDLAELMSNCEAGLMILADVEAFQQGTSPNKFFDYIASGLPVLCNYSGWVSELLKERHCGEVVPPGDAEAFADALVRLADDRVGRAAMGQRARALAEERFDRDQLFRDLNALVGSMERQALMRQKFAHLFRLFRTLRHLKPEQLFYQVYYRVASRNPFSKPVTFVKRPTAFRKWPSDLGLRMPCGQAACRSVEARRFEFIGLSHSFEGPVDWEGAGLGKLWDYNLHYFEWIWSLDVEAAKCFVGDWIERHPYYKGAAGWEPYPLSLRITNWIAYWGTAGRAALESDPNFKATLFGSLGEQCNWLSRRLEKHLLGNHYFENAVALLLAGNFFEASEVPEAAAWKARGRKILLEQLPEQMLPDGMHFERSPMYHNRIIHALEWLVQLGCDDDALQLKDWLERANAAAALLKHPDGMISLFNDSAFGIYPENTSPSPVGNFALPDAGYYGARTGRGDYLIVDAGRIGPDYLPGHAHCDIGSFELSLQGRRFITDSGVKNYEIGELRHYCRSAKAHNTVTPAGMEQAEIWAAFRVGARPNVNCRDWRPGVDSGFALTLAHDGFSRLSNLPVQYERRCEFDGLERITITDLYTDPQKRTWRGQLHFAPEVKLHKLNDQRADFQLDNLLVKLELAGVSKIWMEKTPYFSHFNTTEQRLALCFEVVNYKGPVTISIEWDSDDQEKAR